MILLGCLIGLTAAVAPRVLLFLAWIVADRWVPEVADFLEIDYTPL